MKNLNDKQKEKIAILYRKRRVLFDNQDAIIKTLNPVLEDLEKIRIAIDEIKLENKYGDE